MALKSTDWTTRKNSVRKKGEELYDIILEKRLLGPYAVRRKGGDKINILRLRCLP
jgi:hypothetical protein